MDIFEELIKCKNSFEYFAEKHIQIAHPIKGIIPFELYQCQKNLINDYEKYKYNIGIKFRQGGFTTLTIIYLLWKCMFVEKKTALICARTNYEAEHIGRIVNAVTDKMPEWLKPKGSFRKREKIFTTTNSRMLFMYPGSARGMHVDYLFIDEAAFIPGLEESWKAMYPMIASGGNCIVLSTTNGIGNWFEMTFHNALSKKNNFHACNLSYKDHPVYQDEGYVERIRKNLGEEGFQQEIVGAFIGDINIDSKLCLMAESLAATLTNQELSDKLKKIAKTEWLTGRNDDYFSILEAAKRLC